MCYVFFNLLLKSIDFHVHFWFLLSKKGTFKGLFEKKGTLAENFGGADNTPAPSPAPEGLFFLSFVLSHWLHHYFYNYFATIYT